LAAASTQHTLHGAELSWLHLMLLGALPMEFVDADPSEPTVRAPALAVSELQASPGDTIDLLDPEGVTLAQLTVRSFDGHRLAGSIQARSGFSIVDHVAHRARAGDTLTAQDRGLVWALWVDAPVPYAVRAWVREAARANGATVVEFVPVPTGYETSRTANASVRLALAHTTRDASDRMLVVPWPGAPWDEAGVRLRATIAAAYGANALVVADPTVADIEAPLPVRVVEVPDDHRAIPLPMLDALVIDGAPLPAWAAEPAVAREIGAIHRPAGRRGLTVMLSGLSGSGKSTVARSLAVRLVEHEARSVSLLDGDVVRHHLSKGLGFTRPDRITNVTRIGFVASEITKAGGIAVCCPIAPYDQTRRAVRAMVTEHGSFVLVHVATPLAECERRDRKGLYAKARRGEIPEFTGISDPYETPTDAEIVIDTTGRSIDACVDDVYRYLIDAGLIER
jgi:sulfate adenylyltransferase